MSMLFEWIKMGLFGLIKYEWRINATNVSRQPKRGSLPKPGSDLGLEGGGPGHEEEGCVVGGGWGRGLDVLFR